MRKKFFGMKMARAGVGVGVTIALAAVVLGIGCNNDDQYARFALDPNEVTSHTLSVYRNPHAGGSVSVNGTTTSGTTTTHNNNASVQVCATAVSGYTFTGWSGASTSSSRCVTITMSQDQSLTANFLQQRTLILTRSPAAGGTVTVDGSAMTGTTTTTTHNNNASVQVCATAASGYTFTGWTGASTSSSSCVTIAMSADRSLTANFSERINSGLVGTWQTAWQQSWSSYYILNLRSDGTYTYALSNNSASQTGTWYVSGNDLYLGSNRYTYSLSGNTLYFNGLLFTR